MNTTACPIPRSNTGPQTVPLGGLGRVIRPRESDPEVLEARWQACANAKNWVVCVELARALVAAAPERESGWVHRAYSLHALGRTQEAYEGLLPAVERFPASELIPYNLACYICRLGRPLEALAWLKRAFEAGDPNRIRLTALDDPDLESLWVEIGRLGPEGGDPWRT
ncbi:MAG: tetratricopeptide repeat protein [Verrucomicrobia bacterium]|nr:tetratricopeptide repeat protein [Verrucomicrobiota bacterium]